jgi:hypothetical protein
MNSNPISDVIVTRLSEGLGLNANSWAPNLKVTADIIANKDEVAPEYLRAAQQYLAAFVIDHKTGTCGLCGQAQGHAPKCYYGQIRSEVQRKLTRSETT